MHPASANRRLEEVHAFEISSLRSRRPGMIGHNGSHRGVQRCGVSPRMPTALWPSCIGVLSTQGHLAPSLHVLSDCASAELDGDRRSIARGRRSRGESRLGRRGALRSADSSGLPGSRSQRRRSCQRSRALNDAVIEEQSSGVSTRSWMSGRKGRPHPLAARPTSIPRRQHIGPAACLQRGRGGVLHVRTRGRSDTLSSGCQSPTCR